MWVILECYYYNIIMVVVGKLNLSVITVITKEHLLYISVVHRFNWIRSVFDQHRDIMITLYWDTVGSTCFSSLIAITFALAFSLRLLVLVLYLFTSQSWALIDSFLSCLTEESKRHAIISEIWLKSYFGVTKASAMVFKLQSIGILWECVSYSVQTECYPVCAIYCALQLHCPYLPGFVLLTTAVSH